MNFTPQHVDEKIEQFLKYFNNYLKKLPKEYLKKLKSSIINKVSANYKNLE